MRLQHVLVAGAISAGSMAGFGQTTVTGNGSAGKVPVFTTTGSTIGDSVIYQSTNGNVGIGTTSPDAPLKVNTSAGTTKIFGPNLELNNFGAEYNLSVSSGNFNVQNNSDAGAPTRFTILGGSGNVGIGTTNPAYPLDVNGGMNAATVNGTAMFTGHQLGGTYAYSDAIFKAVTDNPNGSANYYFQGLAGSKTNFSVRADGQAYFAGGINSGSYSFISSYRGSSNNFTNLFMGGALVDNGNGSYTVQTDGGSNYFAAIRMDNSGGNAGAINFYTAGSSGGSSYTIPNSQLPSYQRMTIVGSNVGIGTSFPGAKLEVNGNIRLTSGSGASMTYPDGTVQSTAWNGTTCGGDYAESIDVTGDRKSYEPGDVLVVDPKLPGKFLKSSEPYATTVMGIYSTQPGLTGRRVGAPKTGEEVPMAMLGIVPTKVSTENGPIKPGDLLVTSSTPGYAMKATDRSRMVGALIGKALDYLESGTGVIEVGIALQ